MVVYEVLKECYEEEQGGERLGKVDIPRSQNTSLIRRTVTARSSPITRDTISFVKQHVVRQFFQVDKVSQYSRMSARRVVCVTLGEAHEYQTRDWVANGVT